MAGLIVRIKGVLPWDGDYPLELKFNHRELHLIKKIAGVRGAELEEAFLAGDTDMVVALTLIALKRAGMNAPEDDIWEASTGAIVLDVEAEEEADAVPPAEVTPSEPSSSVNVVGSGPGTNGGSDLPETTPSLSGIRG